jgi:hypothetical protein
MSKPVPARYRTTSWSEYCDALRGQGSLLVRLDHWTEWSAPNRGRPGWPAVVSDAAIQFCLRLKVPFGRALWQTVVLVASLLKLVGLDWLVPSFFTPSQG